MINSKFKILILAILLNLIAIDAYSQGLTKTVISVTGSVFNQVTKEPETCAILVFDEEGNRVTATRSNASSNGNFFLTGLFPGKTYNVELKKKDFLAENFSMTMPNSDRYVEISRDFLIKPMEVGLLMPISVPPFELNKSKLRFGAELFMNDWVSTLKSNPEIKVEVISFPDNNDDQAENKQVTEQRIASIKEYFVKNGIAADRLKSGSPNTKTDPQNPLPTKKSAKGKRYIGSTYLKIVGIN